MAKKKTEETKTEETKVAETTENTEVSENAEKTENPVTAENSESSEKSETAEAEKDLTEKLDEKFPAETKEHDTDKKLEAAEAELKDKTAQIEELTSKLKDAEEKEALLLTEINETVNETVTVLTASDGQRLLKKGTIIQGRGRSVILQSDALIRFEDSELSFAGMLAAWHPNNLQINAESLRLKYDGNAALLPLKNQCKPEEVADFIPTLTEEEAAYLGIKPNDHREYVKAAAEKAETEAEKTE